MNYTIGSCNMTQIKRPFISSWITMTVDGTSPETIAHNLMEIPAKVDVQVKINKGGQEYIFPGFGSVPKDDDIGAEYGGVAYSYNISHVLLYVPTGKTTGRVITTGKFARWLIVCCFIFRSRIFRVVYCDRTLL